MLKLGIFMCFRKYISFLEPCGSSLGGFSSTARRF